jgi:gliding motility-associated-like protein
MKKSPFSLLLLFFYLLFAENILAQDVPRLEWVSQMGGAGYNTGEDIFVDGTGNVYTTGLFWGTVDFDPGAGTFDLTSAGASDIFVTKQNSSGALIWAVRMGGTGNDDGFSITVDVNGSVLTTGHYRNTVDFDPGPGVFNLSAGFYDSFISKLDASGNFVWAVKFGEGSNDQNGYSIATDAAGNVYTTGSYINTVDFDPGTGVFNLGSGCNDAYVSKLSPNGDFIWAKRLGGTACSEEGNSLVVDATGNVFIAGRFGDTADFDPNAGTFNLTSAGSNDAFICKLDASGNFLWAKQFGGTSSDEPSTMVMDVSGNLIITGQFSGTADFDPGVGVSTLSSNGGIDVFICKLNNSGDFLWAKSMGGTSGDYGHDIAVDPSGNVYTVGEFRDNVDFDPGAGTFILNGGTVDGFASKLDAGGNFAWAVEIAGSGFDYGYGITVDALENVYTTGSFYSANTDFDPTPCSMLLGSLGTGDIFIQKLSIATPLPPLHTITSFTPTTGPIGSTVNITGTNFSSTPSENLVTFFNNQPSTVTASTTSSLTVTVPTGTTNGRISVNLNCITVQSATNFIVGATPIPTITSFTPTSGQVGATVTITGTNFDPTPSNNTVAFNGTTTVVTASTATTITTTVPAGATTGKITVTVAGNTATSATDFTVTENFITRWNLVTAGSGPTQLSFSTATSGTVNYTWQEISPGTASGSGSWSGTTLNITGLPTGATIRLQIAPSNFQRIIINSGTDSNRLTQVEQWGSTAWTSMQRAFYNCNNLQITATDVPNLSGVTNMSEMFSGCTSLNSPSNMGSWNTSAVTNMYFMFYGATAFNQNISGWNTGAVTNMSTMFSEAASFNQNIGSWNTGAVTDMSGMFQYATAFNQNIGAWNTSAVTDMSSMFSRADSFNQNIGAWNTGAVTDMRNMFRLALAFNQNIGAWTLRPTVDVRNLFDDSGMDCNNYSATLIGWSANPSTPNGRTLGSIGRQYGTNAVAARTNLISTKSWTITGDAPSGAVCGPVSVPTITSFSPSSGPVGTTVTITGTNFSTTLINNIVYFGATRAVVTAATATQLTVTVPIGATYQTISVLVNSLLAYSSKPFITTFVGGGTVDACSFAPKIDLTAGTFPVSIASGDFDGDGKADMAVANYDINIISLFRNTSSIGSISYAAKIDISSGANADHISVDDLDGDGKLDLVTTDGSGASVYRNTSTGTGTISFAARISFAVGGSDPRHAAIDDFDKDGKPDLVVANYGAGVNTISVLRNTSSGPGNISYAPKVDFASTVRPSSVSSGDLDGDGKPDIAVVNQNSNTLSIFRNTSTGIGNISFAAKVDFTTGSNPVFVSIGDLDDDNKPELAVGHSLGTESSVVSVFRNLSSGIGNISYAAKQDFTVGSIPFSVSMGDVDGDGKPDLVAANVSSGNVSVLRNTSTGIGSISFAGKVDFTTNSNSQSVSITDFDGDGKPDLAATSFFGVHVLRNIISLAPTITSFTPTNGAVGSTVTITGTNFSPIPVNNIVSFNGPTAVVTASTATSITTSVPAAATSGTITITVGCNTATSATNFMVTGATTNQPPQITTTSASVPIQGIITIDLEELISDPDDNLDPSTLQIITQPLSGAVASLNNFMLTIDYSGVAFSGTDQIEIGICDLTGVCTQQELTVELAGEIEVFNALSPNGDGQNEFLLLRYIELLPDTQSNHVSIYNRWGDVVWEGSNYNNQTVVFDGTNKNGKELPSGTYFYKIEYSGSLESKTGFLSLKR